MALTQVAAGLLAGSITSSQITSVSGASLTGTQTIPRGTLPTGSVLQVVNATYATSTSTTSASFSSSGLTASITPSSSSSKILITTGGCDISTTSNIAGVKLALYRNTTSLAQYTNNIPYQGSGGSFYITGAPSITYLDSPSTTSSVSYSVYFASQTNGTTVTIQRDGTTATITLMEISA